RSRVKKVTSYLRRWPFSSSGHGTSLPVVAHKNRVLLRWGAPRNHGELRKLGFRVSERTVSRYVRRFRPRRHPGASWKTFVDNHREVLAAMDFFTVPTVTFRLLYVLLVIEHRRRKILHLNVTAHPSAAWVSQQLREAFPFARAPRYLL